MSNIRKILVIGFVIGTALFFISLLFRYFSGYNLNINQSMLSDFGFYQMYAIAITFVNSYFFDALNHRKWGKYARYRIGIGLIGGVIITMVTIIFLRMIQEMAINGKSFEVYYEGEIKNGFFYFINFLVIVAISIFFHAVYFYRELQKKKVTEQKIIAGTASAQFDALKNQLDPHFLFNSLNVLTSLIDESPEAAQKFTTSLSKVYRYVLEQKNKELVSVDEELQFAKTYINLLKMRFEDSIVFEIPDKATNPEARVVPLSLQLLLENAVKHNVVNASKPLHIKIYEKDNMLVVENKLQPKAVIKKGSGVGLVNIQQRYNLLSVRKVNINKTAESFLVELPMLTKQISIMKTQESYIEDKRYIRAKEKVEAIKGFYSNLISYMIVIPFLAFINYMTTNFPWVIFPILGWGIGLLFHGMEAFGYNPFMGKNWEERKIRELMDKE